MIKIVGVDIGSSAIKACCFDFPDDDHPRLTRKYIEKCPLLRPQAGWVEHNLQKMESLLENLIDGIEVGSPLSFTSAMHSLVILNPAGQPLTNAISWADSRSAKQAIDLKEKFPQHHQRTGTPIHPMAWPAKLSWLRLRRPVWWNQIARVTDLKAFLLERLIGRPMPMDLSNASATGLWDQKEQCWDKELLAELELPENSLPEVQTGVEPFMWKGRQVFLGGGDGPLGNLGVGAVVDKRVAMSVGTSGALRQLETSDSPLPSALFRYSIDHELAVRGAAISNGTSVLDWLCQHYEATLDDVLGWVESAETGANGLKIYPYFQGERAPFWSPEKTAAVLGLNFQHQPADVARAAVEGVAFCLRRLYQELEPGDEPIRCTGGFFASPSWVQLLANVLGKPLAVSPIEEATSLGAALLALEGYREHSAALPAGAITEPDLVQTAVYDELFEDWVTEEPGLSKSSTG